MDVEREAIDAVMDALVKNFCPSHPDFQNSLDEQQKNKEIWDTTWVVFLLIAATAVVGTASVPSVDNTKDKSVSKVTRRRTTRSNLRKNNQTRRKIWMAVMTRTNTILVVTEDNFGTVSFICEVTSTLYD